MKSFRILVGSLTVFFVALGVGCLADDHRMAPTNSSQQSFPTIRDSNMQIKGSDYPDILGKRSEFEKVVKEMSRVYGISGLKNVESPNDLELRLWSSPGLAYPTCLILTRSEHNWKAKLLSPGTRIGSDANSLLHKVPVKVQGDLVPKSGWNFLEDLLERSGVIVPLRFTYESREEPPIPDEGEMFLEIRQNKDYDLVGYRALTKDPDGKRLLDLCSELEIEFDLSIGCFQ